MFWVLMVNTKTSVIVFHYHYFISIIALLSIESMNFFYNARADNVELYGVYTHFFRIMLYTSLWLVPLYIIIEAVCMNVLERHR